MSQYDPLADYRGMRPEHLRQAHQQPKPEGDSLYNRMAIGIAAEKLMAGVASVDDIANVMRRVIEQAERDAMEGVRDLLGCPDLLSAEARETHFRARVAASTLTYINELIRSGQKAGAELTENQEDTRS